MPDFNDVPDVIEHPIVSATQQVTKASQLIIPDSLRGGNVPMQANTVLEVLMAFRNLSVGGQLPAVLDRLMRDLSVAILNTGAGVNSQNVYFPTPDASKPFSIDFLTESPWGTDVITGDSTGLEFDTTIGMAPEQVDALGGVANRYKLTVTPWNTRQTGGGC